MGPCRPLYYLKRLKTAECALQHLCRSTMLYQVVPLLLRVQLTASCMVSSRLLSQNGFYHTIELASNMISCILLSVIFLARQAVSTGSPLYQSDPDNVKDCVEWYNNDDGDSCDNVRKYFDITPAEFNAWNPSISIYCEPWYEWASYCIVTETKLNATKPTTA